MASTTNPKGMSPKDPDERYPVRWNWQRTLQGFNEDDTLLSGLVTLEGGDGQLDLQETAVDDYVVERWIDGGTPGETYKLMCSIVTEMGLELQEPLYVKVKTK